VLDKALKELFYAIYSVDKGDLPYLGEVLGFTATEAVAFAKPLAPSQSDNVEFKRQQSRLKQEAILAKFKNKR